eukprot:135349_1
MNHLIKSKLLSMSNCEFNQFITQLINISGRKTFIDLLFEHCIENENNPMQAQTNGSSIKLIDAISILSSIISRRKTKLKPEQQFDTNVANQTNQPMLTSENNEIIQTNYFHMLPSILISNTASYLHCNDYFNFANCSLKTYISCHLPCKLQHLPLKKYPTNLSLQRFKWIKSLIINIKYFNEHYENKKIWNKNCLSTLKLSNLNGNESDPATFMNNNSIVFNNKLQKLCLANFGTNLSPYNAILFGKLLTNFKMINELVLWDIHLTKGYLMNEKDIIKWFPNLDRLVCTYNVNKQLTFSIIHSIGHRLKALALWQVNNIKVNSKGLPKLEELVLYIHGFSQILHCFQNANVSKLKCVKISSDNKEMLSGVICWIFSKQHNLQRVQINIQSKYLKYVMELCANMLNDNLVKSMRISNKLVIGFHSNWNDGIVKYLEKMVVKLRDLLYGNEFALTIRMENRRQYNQIHGDDVWLNMVENWLNKLNGMNIKFNTIYEFKTVHCTDIFSFTISNKNCKIHGYRHDFIDLL